MVLYLMRHCESIWNCENRYSGHKDIPLTDNGRRHATEIGDLIGKFPIKRLISSDLVRAIDTALPISLRLQIPMEINSNFREINFGKLEGKKIADIKKVYPKIWQSYIENPLKTRFPGGETCGEALQRSINAIDEMYKSGTLNGTLIVLHGTILRVLTCYLVGIDSNLFRRVFCGVNNGSMTLIKISDASLEGGFQIQGRLLTFNQDINRF